MARRIRSGEIEGGRCHRLASPPARGQRVDVGDRRGSGSAVALLPAMVERKRCRGAPPPPWGGGGGEGGLPPASQRRQNATHWVGVEPLSLSLPLKGGGNATLQPARLFAAGFP